MNRIEDEQIKFYLEHSARIREWADLEAKVSDCADQFYRSLKGDLDAALRSGKIADDGVESFFPDGGSPGLGLRRHDWPRGHGDPDVRLEWQRKSPWFSPEGIWLGVKANVDRYGQPFTKEARPNFPLSSRSYELPAYVYLDPPTGRFWEGDNLKEYRDFLLETIFAAWKELAPLVDESVGHLRK